MHLKRARQTYLCKDRVWTDYPMVGFGDAPGEQAPMREAYMLHDPTDKYVKILVIGTEDDDRDYTVGEVKIGYLYQFKDEANE